MVWIMGHLLFSFLNYVNLNKGDGSSSALEKFSYANTSLSKRCKGSRYYLLYVITVLQVPKMKKLMLWLVLIFVDDGQLTPLLIKLCDL